jgi:hypothetical protein
MAEREMYVLHVQGKMSAGLATRRNLVELAVNDIEN